ncbi:MAG: TIGR00180 family glycosyltransferase [Burkholderiaceae bacterium]|nr:TIGR00180 family glycosyltransferase [Burkholderiaceae bacterium]
MTASNLDNWLVSSLQNSSVVRKPFSEALSLLTVVIPCYGRQDFLLRQCVYWHGSGVAVVIVDGSALPLGECVQQTLSGLRDITYLYSATSVMDRLKQASEHIHTRYAILLGDDEFLLLTGLCSAIAKLEQDPALVACIGQSIAFYPSGDGGSCRYGTGYPHWRYSVRNDDIQARLNASMSDYTAATCYAVLRTPVWRKSWGQQENWSSPYTGEIQQALTTYIWGKLTTVDEVYWMRSSENRPVNNKGFNRGLSFQEWWASPIFKTEHDRFIAILSGELVSVQHMTPVKAEAIIREAVDVFITHMSEVDRGNVGPLTSRKAIVRHLRATAVKVLKRLLPQQLLEHLKSAVFRFRSAPGKGNLGTLAELKQMTTPSLFVMDDVLAEELSAMEALIASFYAARRCQAT